MHVIKEQLRASFPGYTVTTGLSPQKLCGKQMNQYLWVGWWLGVFVLKTVLQSVVRWLFEFPVEGQWNVCGIFGWFYRNHLTGETNSYSLSVSVSVSLHYFVMHSKKNVTSTYCWYINSWNWTKHLKKEFISGVFNRYLLSISCCVVVLMGMWECHNVWLT